MVAIVFGCVTVTKHKDNRSSIEEATTIKAEEISEETTIQEITTEVTTKVTTTQCNKYKYYTEQDAIDIAKVLYNECRGVPSKTEQACVAWTILNRVDKNNSSVYKTVRAKNQFAFYENTIVDSKLLELSYDVLDRWNKEKCGQIDVGRVLPKDYTYFEGRNGRNYFRNSFKGSYSEWNYSLQSPYQT